MKRKLILLLFFIIILQNNVLYATDLNIPEPSFYFYVYDEANLLDKSAEDYIIKTNEELYKKTGAQIVVATISSLNNEDINLLALEIFEKWQIGSREYDNGLLMLIAPNEREIRIEVGYGLEGALPDSKVGNIIENSILPYFRENNYQKGIISGFNEIIQEVEEEYGIQVNRQDIDEDLYYIDEYEETNVFNGPGKIFYILGIIAFLFIDFKFFNGLLTRSILLRSSRLGGSPSSSRRGNKGGGGRSGGGGARGRW
ncbi:MAG: TPM domain-containing protein [Tissierellia bacterium]|nr:TPM domain-containing protein [Tissierellia bacterium]